jgi:ABC-2 type transport system ATP-binding protein
MTDDERTRRPSAVHARNLRVVRGKTVVLPDFSVQIPSGAITGLLGPSGCGKTTLMRSIVGTQMVASGTVTVLGHPAGSPPLRRRVGYVTQDPTIYNDLRVIDNVRYFAALYGMPADAADTAIDGVGLTDHSTATCGNLSGGQRTRVSLACAARRGTTLLVSSHVMDEADQCRELILMREGRLLAHTTPDRLRKETRCTSLEDAFLSVIRHTTAARAD